MNSPDIENGEQYEDDECSDYDTCTSEELKALFSSECKQLLSKQIISNNKYILSVDATRESTPTIAASSPTTVDILNYSGSNITKIYQLPIENKIVGVKFSPTDNNLLYVATSNASIAIFDIRTPQKQVKKFTDTTVNEDGEMKTFLSFDISPDSRLLTAGTELFDGEAFILFWDLRKETLMGGYWESHTDDILQVAFHNQDRNILASGSTDGLINVYNLTEETEDDALIECLNTENSVEQLNWCGDNLFCATHTHDVQMWSLQDVTPYGDFKRDHLSRMIKRKSEEHNYVAGCFVFNNQPSILIGSNYENGECLRCLKVVQNQVQPLFECKENSQRVRAVTYCDQTRHLITGGEKGIIDIWKIND